MPACWSIKVEPRPTSGCSTTPRAVFPIHALERIHNRAKAASAAASPRALSAAEIVLPTIPGSKASGAIIRVAGIESGFAA